MGLLRFLRGEPLTAAKMNRLARQAGATPLGPLLAGDRPPGMPAAVYLPAPLARPVVVIEVEGPAIGPAAEIVVAVEFLDTGQRVYNIDHTQRFYDYPADAVEQLEFTRPQVWSVEQTNAWRSFGFCVDFPEFEQAFYRLYGEVPATARCGDDPDDPDTPADE